MEETLARRLIVASLFAISFTLIGWTAPILYATHAPADNFIEVHDFGAQNTSTNAEMHYICFDRTVKQSSSGTVYTELYLINEDNDRVEVSSGESIDRYFQDGRHEVITPLQLPPNLEKGSYRYLLVAELNLADGRVERSFEYNSERFYISDDYNATPTREEFSC